MLAVQALQSWRQDRGVLVNRALELWIVGNAGLEGPIEGLVWAKLPDPLCRVLKVVADVEEENKGSQMDGFTT